MGNKEDIYNYTQIWDMIGFLSRTSQDLKKTKRLVQTKEFQNLFEKMRPSHD